MGPRSLLVTAFAVAACTSQRDAGKGSDTARGAGGALAVSTTPRATLRVVGRDTLSDSAQVVRLVPEPDGDAVAFVFADAERRIHGGLGIVQRDSGGSGAAQLLWPDSVTAVWWHGPHAIAFSTETGRGAYVVVDVHAKEATVAPSDSAKAPARSDSATAAATAARDAAQRRAIAYIDSLHVQPTGRPQGNSALRYEVRSVLMAPGGRLGAFYAAATDSAGRRVNPAWFIIDPQSGAVAPVDEVVGPTSELPESAGGWTESAFVFAKRLGLYESTVSPRAP